MPKCSPVNLLHIFRTPFIKNTSGRLLLSLADREPVLPKILTKAIQKNYKIKEMEEVPFFNCLCCNICLTISVCSIIHSIQLLFV